MASIKKAVRNWIYRTLNKEESPIRQHFALIEEQNRALQADLSRLSNQLSPLGLLPLINEELVNPVSVLHKNDFSLLICNEYLHQYHNKQKTKDYTDHFVSYCYEAPAGYANLGDYIQTLATELAIKQCVEKDSTPVKFEQVFRSHLTNHQGGTCIMQAWYEHKSLTFLPGPDTRPIWIGTHFNADARNLLNILYNNSEYRLSDVGCRDKSTLAFCQSMGMSSYFSRCLTLTLPKRSSEDTNGAKYTYVVDCSEEIISLLPVSLKKKCRVVSQRGFRFQPWQSCETCRTAAENLLEEYKKNAKLVITTALHCAQPCLALGIPVVFVYPVYNYKEEERFSSMDGILPQYTLQDLKDGTVVYPEKAPDIEELKKAILRNLRLSLKTELSKEELEERNNVRKFVEEYNIIN